MESILAYVKRRLRDIGPTEWPAVMEGAARFAEGDLAKSTARKIAYERTSTTVGNIEPLYRYFIRRDYGQDSLPHEHPPIVRNGKRSKVA